MVSLHLRFSPQVRTRLHESCAGEAKELLGGIFVFESRDMNHAVQLMAQHPALKYGNIF